MYLMYLYICKSPHNILDKNNQFLSETKSKFILQY